MNKLETIEIINLVKRLPNSPVLDRTSLEEMVTLFLAVLGDLPADMVRAATIQYLSEANPFFPTPGILREKAMDLQLLAAGIPTAGEAWGMVLTANRPVDPVFCDEGRKLRDAANDPATYWQAVKDYGRHVDSCPVCDLGGYRENYQHPAVAETVRLLGGRDVILTDNPTADRARFIEAYREVIAREKMKMGMTPAVAEFIENNKPLLVGEGIKKLAARLER